MRERQLEKKNKKSLIAFSLLFHDLTYRKMHYFTVMVTVMQVKYLRKAFTKENLKKMLLTF